MTPTTTDFNKPLELLRIADALGKLIDHAVERGAVNEAEFFSGIASSLMDSCFTPNADLRSHEPPRTEPGELDQDTTGPTGPGSTPR